MKLLDFLDPGSIFFQFSCSSKKDFFDRAVSEIIRKNKYDEPDRMKELFSQREETLSTAIGGGVAIPHIIYDRATAQQLYIFRLRKPLDFNALDNRPVEIVFALVAASVQPAIVHLQTLAKIGLMLKKESFLHDLLLSADADEIFEVVKKYD